MGKAVLLATLRTPEARTSDSVAELVDGEARDGDDCDDDNDDDDLGDHDGFLSMVAGG